LLSLITQPLGIICGKRSDCQASKAGHGLGLQAIGTTLQARNTPPPGRS